MIIMKTSRRGMNVVVLVVIIVIGGGSSVIINITSDGTVYKY